MDISIIAAVSTDGVIGIQGGLPWHLPDDMAYFKKTTMGHPVIMGRKSYEALPRSFCPLPGRQNIVLSHNEDKQIAGVEVAHSLTQAFQYAQHTHPSEIFIIGGGEVFAESMDLANKLYLTHIHARLRTGVRFPAWDKHDWQCGKSTLHPKDDRHAYAFEHKVYVRVRAAAAH